MSPDFRGFKVTIDSLYADGSSIVRDEFWNEFKIQFASNYGIDTITRAFHTSDALFTELLNDAIQKPIHTAVINSRPDSYETLSGIKSDSLYKWTLQDSDNLFAEQIMLMISGQKGDTLSTEQSIALTQAPWWFQSNSPFPYELIWRDGSGLSRYNMFKPSEFQKLLKLFDKEKLIPLLPQGDTSGTLKDWYGTYVYAKTGTLSNNHALVGFIHTKSGKWLKFSFMVNHYTAPTSTIRESIGVILQKIYYAY